MVQRSRVIAGVGLTERPRKSSWPARMDLAQSLSGLILGLFMWGHMFFVSSILVSKDFMWTITKMFEAYFFVGRAFPGIVSVIVFTIVVLVVLHAFLAMRKFPANYRQYRLFVGHKNLLRHEDTTLWWVQVVTGFALFFLATVHLYQMLMHPGDIGPYESADRVWTGDTLLIGGTGRTDLPGGDAAALHDSLFGHLLKLDPALQVYPAHDYKGRSHSTIGAELASSPRL